MIHPATELRHVDAVVGHGVFATAPIPRGTITWALDPLDRVMTPDEVAALPPALAFDMERYLWLDRHGRYILAWDLARFVNHSCAPNCLTTPYGFEIAVADIAPGEQLSNDYAELGMGPSEVLSCSCGAPACRGYVVPGQAGMIRSQWAGEIEAAVARAASVDQPLISLLDATLVERLALRPGIAPPAVLAAPRRRGVRTGRVHHRTRRAAGPALHADAPTAEV